MDLLNMFEEVKIDNNSRLSKEDAIKMDEFRNTLEEMREGYNKYIEFFRSNPIIGHEKDPLTFCIESPEKHFSLKMFDELHYFVCHVYGYFRKKYSVELITKEYSKKVYNDIELKKRQEFWFETLTVDLILEDIFNQLEGVNFEDRAEQELKEKVQKKARWDNRLSVKGKNVSINSYFYVSGYWWNLQDDIRDLLNLLSIGAYNSIEPEEVEKVIQVMKEEKNNTDSIDGTYQLNFNQMKQLKIFKNGKVQITFSSGRQALEFAREYLNYQS